MAEIQHGNDVLDGGAGADSLVGGGKDDGLFGGTGNDMLYGDDTIHIENQLLSDAVNPPMSYNHSQRVLTDSLALYAAYAQVDASASDAGNDEAWKEAA